jgi:hypothetical protein
MKVKIFSALITASLLMTFNPIVVKAEPPQVGIVATAALGVVLQNLTDQLNKVIDNMKVAGQVVTPQILPPLKSPTN